MSGASQGPCLALSGGVGGAKLALGLAQLLPPDKLTIVANTGDDFEHLGLMICPDLDTVMYTLAGLANPETGWGREGESWAFMDALEKLGGETWFRLGDKDLAVHVVRTQRLTAGESLSAVTADFCRRFSVGPRLVPMSDARVATHVHTAEGSLSFQHYFVREKCVPVVRGFAFSGAGGAWPSPGFQAALEDGNLAAIVICPSNPYVSIDPILSVNGVSHRLRGHKAPVIAVSPIVGGEALKGPTAKMMRELGVAPSPQAVAAHYGDLLDGFILDEANAAAAPEIEARGLAVRVAPTVMRTLADKAALAAAVLAFAHELGVERKER